MRAWGVFLLVVGLTVARSAAGVAQDRTEQEKAAEAIKKLGGKVRLDGEGNVVEVNLEGTQVTDDDLRFLKALMDLRKLDLEETRITDAGLVHLKVLTKLEELDLEETRITDAGLEHLRGLTNLRKLSLDDTRVTAKGVRVLQEALPNLKVDR
jgi:Leucine-rich repeat (LRR) protein